MSMISIVEKFKKNRRLYCTIVQRLDQYPEFEIVSIEKQIQINYHALKNKYKLRVVHLYVNIR